MPNPGSATLRYDRDMRAILTTLSHVLKAMQSHHSALLKLTEELAQFNAEVRERFKRVDPSDRLRG